MSRVDVAPAKPTAWQAFTGRTNQWWLVVDGERCRRISGYEAHAIQQLVDAQALTAAAKES